MNEAHSPSVADFIFQNHKNEQWWSSLGIDKNNYFAITFSWQIFGSGKKKVWQQCHEDKNRGCFVYVCMSADEFERETV